MAKVMIADDSDAIRMILREALSIDKHEVIGEAVMGKDVIEKFNNLMPELLLLDLNMPGMEGIDVIKTINSEHPNTKIIIISGTEDEKTINECIRAGALTHIRKPFDISTLLKIITSHIK